MCQILQVGWVKGVTAKQLNGISGNSWKTRVSENYRLRRAWHQLYSTFASIFVYIDEQ